MILKKPYAILIKRFRLIHLILFGSILYVIIATNPLLKTFKTLVNTGSLQFTGKSSPLAYIFALLIVIFSSAILLLLRSKQKPRIFYIVSTIYYFIVLIGIFFANTGINNLSVRAIIDIQTSRAYNDIFRIILYPQYFFLLYTLVRAIGFDIRRFNFGQDLADLEVDEKDSEEFEFVLGIDYRQYLVKVRRYFRELRYYFLENTTILVGALIITLGVGAFFMFFRKEIVGKTYKENQVFASQGIQYTVNHSYVTNMDKSGDLIQNNEYYAIVDLTFKNFNPKKTPVNVSGIVLQNGIVSFPVDKYDSNDFIDLGVKYRQEEIFPDESINRLIVFRMNAYSPTESLLFKVSNGTFLNKKTNQTEIKYIDVELNPRKNTNSQIMLERFLGTRIGLDSSSLMESKFNITNFEVRSSFTYPYEECITEDDCRARTGVILPDMSRANKKILVLDYEVSIDRNSLYYKTIQESPINFFKDFVKIRYVINSREVIIKPIVLNPKDYDKKAILEVDTLATEADKLDVLITIRNQIFVIRLK